MQDSLEGVQGAAAEVAGGVGNKLVEAHVGAVIGDVDL